MKRQRLEQQAVDRQQDAHADRHEQEQGQGRRRYGTQGEAAEHEPIARQFDQRAEPFEQRHERPGQPAGRAAARAEGQARMPAEAFGQAALPAAALAAEGAEVFGAFGPADRVGQVTDAVGNARLAMMAMQAHHQLHVLAHGIGAVAADGHDPFTVEQAEGAGDDQHRVERRPAEAAEEKGAQILDDLKARQPVAWQPGADEKTAAHLRAVGDAHGAAGGNGALVFEERLDHPQQAVALQDGVGVDTAEQAVARCVDAGVQRIGLAAVGLVHHPQIGVATRAVDGSDRLVRHRLAQRLGMRQQLEFLDQQGQGAVAGAIVDHHHLELGVLQLQHRAHRSTNGRLFVEGGHEHRHRWLHAQVGRSFARFGAPPHVAHQAGHRQQIEQQIGAIEQQEVADEAQLQPPEPANAHRFSSTMARRRASWP